MATAKRCHTGSKADEESAHAHAKSTRGEHVTGLVERHSNADSESKKNDAQDVCHK